MNDNSLAISRYLQHEMNDEEITSFESMLAADPSLREELLAQQKIMQAAQNAGLKQTFASLIHKKMMWQRFTWSAGILLLLVITIVIYFVVEENSNGGKADKQAVSADSLNNPFIQPPLANADVPWSNYELDAEKGDTIFHSTGSILLFPPSSMVDENGQLIKGKVQLRYREFSNPLDFYLAGIPMDYDSAGTKYTFVSAGMFELLAQQNGKAVFVNAAAKPEINVVTNDKSSLHNIYYLDTVQKKWLPQLKSVVTDLSGPQNTRMLMSNNGNGESVGDDYSDLKDTVSSVAKPSYKMPPQPIIPLRASNKNPIIRITVDPLSFKELMAYNDLQFELLPNEKNFNPQDTTGEWSDVQLTKSENTGIYVVKFSRPGRSVSYQAKPVFEGTDYDKAMIVFKKKQAEYEQAKKEREEFDKTNEAAYSNQVAENSKIDRYNAEMEKRNQLAEKNNEQVLREDERIKIENEQRRLQKIVDVRNRRIQLEEMKIRMQIMQAQDSIDAVRMYNNALAMSKARANTQTFRTVTINQFGTWNCDYPQRLDRLIPITATFVDSSGHVVQLTHVSVICKESNTIYKFPGNNMGLVKNVNNMILGTMNDHIYYAKFDAYDFRPNAYGITYQSFKMNIYGDQSISYFDAVNTLFW